MGAPANTELLELVASSLEYPNDRSIPLAREAAERAAPSSPELARAFERLAEWLQALPAGEAEERYTALFDLSPVCTLHAGYHLFGETYQRGALLAGLAAELRKAEVEERGELSDFIPTLLRLLPRQSEEDRATLVDYILLPALLRMDTALKESTSPWAGVLRALPKMLAPLGTGQDVASHLMAPPPDTLRAYTEAADLPERGDRHMPAFDPPPAASSAR
jgi:nitrate reductase delta subunit